MSKTHKRTISLTATHAEFIDKSVETGTYASTSEVVRAGLRALQERDAIVEHWLQQDVVPAYDELLAHPERKISADELAKRLDAHHAEQLPRVS